MRKGIFIIALVLLGCCIANAQMVRPRKPSEPVIKREEPAPVKRTDGAILERDNTLKYTAFYNNPCSVMITREELEAIWKRNDNDRALVSVGEPGWYDNGTRVGCGYAVKYEQRIFPDDANDNSLVIWLHFDNEHAKQGQLIIDPAKDPFQLRRYSDSDFDIEVVNGVGDEAIYFRDKSRFKYEERRASTAGGSASAYQHYDNGDFLYVRKKQLLLGFRIKRIVAGGSDPNNVIRIARKALERVP